MIIILLIKFALNNYALAHSLTSEEQSTMLAIICFIKKLVNVSADSVTNGCTIQNYLFLIQILHF